MHSCCDIHTHVVPERFPPYTGRHRDVPWPAMADAHACHKHVVISGRNYRTVHEGSWSPARRLADMAAMRVGRQALSPMPELLSYWLPLDDARALIRYLNDQIAELVAAAPAQFSGLGAVPLQDVDAALDELRYACDTLGFAGVEIASHVNGVSIGDPRFAPFFAEAERIGAAIFVHALRPAGAERIVGPFSEQAVCFPGDIALAAASLITGGIGTRHPALRIAFSHGGGALPILLPRLGHAWRTLPGLREQLAEPPDDIARRFFYDALVFDAASTRLLLERFGVAQLLLGSDYPYPMGDADPVGALHRAGLDDAAVTAIAIDNPRRFLGLD
ncbi:MAG: amidohydrolase family protein [Lautropia sp.]